MPEPTIEGKYPEMSLRDVYYTLFRHKWKVFAFFLAVTVPVTALTLLSPDHYRSEAKLLLRIGRESVTLDPTVTTGGPTIPVGQSRESELNSELEILKSTALAEKVVDALGPPAFLKRTPAGGPSPGAALDPALVENPALEAGGLSSRQKAILELMKHLHIEVPKASSIIAISYEATSPKLAQEVIAKLLEYYQEMHIAVHRTPGSFEFFTQEADRLRTALVNTEEELRSLKNRTGIASPDEQRNSIMSRISELQREVEQTEAALTASRARIDAIQRLQADLPKNQMTPQTAKQLQTDIMTEETTLSSLEAKVKTLRQQLASARASLLTFTDNATKIAQLQRDKEMQETRYKKFSDNLEQARIDQALETEKISNISVVQAATYPLVPVGGKKILHLALSFLFGGLGGIGLAFLLDYVDHSFRKPEDVEERLAVPTLASIPDLAGKPVTPLANGGDTVQRLAAAPGGAREVRAEWEIAAGLEGYYEGLIERLVPSVNSAAPPPRILAVAGCSGGEGASTVAANIAASLARRARERVLLLDAAAIENASANGTPHFAVSAFARNGDLVGTYDSKDLPDLLGSLRRDFGFVVIDMPAVLRRAPHARLCHLIDGVILVVEAERVRWEVAQRAKEVLAESEARFLGVVLNRRRFPIPDWLYKTL
jgi:uncharacterized protein involved in exopolysaccharide biosynthesis/Mrp family chromosome partitioning ATPase